MLLAIILKQPHKQKSKYWVTFPYYGEFSEKMKRIIHDYDISAQLTPANTSRNFIVHHEDRFERGMN